MKLTAGLVYTFNSSRQAGSVTDYETATELTNPTDVDATSFCDSEDTAR